MAKTNNNEKDERSFRKGSNTKRGNSSSRKKDKKFERKEDRYDKEANRGQTRASNDPSWYGADSTLMRDAANLSFNQMGGMPFDLLGKYGSRTKLNKLPGIYKADYIPVPGTMGDWTAPFNVAIRRIYSFIRHANSGSKNYDAADLGNYIIAYDSVVTMYAWMARVYGMVRTIMVRNRFTPEVITRVLGVDYTDVVSNLAQFRYFINTYAARANAMKVPSTFHLYERHMWLASNIFMDAPVEQAQFYLPNPKWLWKFEVDEDSAQHVPFPLFKCVEGTNNTEDPDGALTFHDIVLKATTLLDTILNSEDFNIMSGDVMKAYGDKVFTLNGIGEEYMTVPTFDPEFTLQFQNATILTYPEDVEAVPPYNWKIAENTAESANVGALRLTSGTNDELVIDAVPAGEDFRNACYNNLYLITNKICNLPMANPTPKDVAIATRMMVSAERRFGNFDSHWSVVIRSYGTEIFLNARLYALGTNGRPKQLGYAQDPLDNVNTEIFTGHPYYFDVEISTGTSIDWNPTTNTTGGNLTGLVPYGDFDNFAMVGVEVLNNIHSAALYGIYGLIE